MEWKNGADFVQKWLKAQSCLDVVSPRGLEHTVLSAEGD